MPTKANVGPAAALSDLRETVDALREKLLEVAGWNCPPCQTDGLPMRGKDGRWWHEVEWDDDDETHTEMEECDSHGIHEALYQFDKAREVKDV